MYQNQMICCERDIPPSKLSQKFVNFMSYQKNYVKFPLSHNSKNFFGTFLDLDMDLDDFQNLMVTCLFKNTSLV